ncbi:MAG: TMEM43 family protein [Proteobacteria bacterium]|nr:TMEM43 family protein [Pseudomonadota bacterium]
MAEDSYTEVSNRSWFSRIGGAFKGIIVGLVLMAAAFGLLFWNEGRAVERYKTLKEGGGIVQTVSAQTVDSGNAGRLVHVTGRAETTETLTDPEMGVQAQAIALIREVEMYQWKESSRSETRKKLGGGEETVTTYTYGKEWSERIIDSASFKKPDGHSNPGRMAYQSKTIRAENVRLGAFNLPGFLVRKIGGESPLTISSDVRPPLTQPGAVQMQTNGFYFGRDSNSPQVGDLRMTYRVVLPAEISLVARQVGTSFEPYKAAAGGTIELLSMGIHAADTMFQEAQQENTIMTWALRFAGFVLMAIGSNMLLAPLVVLADVVPAIGSLIGAGTKFISTLLSGVLSFITIAIAWFVYRPLLALSLLGVAVVICVVLFRKIKKADPVVAPPLPPATPPPVPGS